MDRELTDPTFMIQSMPTVLNNNDGNIKVK